MTSDAPKQEISGAIVDPDKDLVAQAKKELPNRTNAYEVLMRKYEKLLFRVCCRIIGNTQDAEDVFQEVMVKVFNSLGRFEGRSTFKTWLFTITHNTCYSSISRLAKTREFKKMMKDDNDEESASHKMSDAELECDRLLAKLSVEEREMLTLKYVVELNFEEIAQVFDMGVSAVKMRIYRAVEALKTTQGG